MLTLCDVLGLVTLGSVIQKHGAHSLQIAYPFKYLHANNFLGPPFRVTPIRCVVT